MAKKKGKKKIIIGTAAVGGIFLTMDVLRKRRGKSRKTSGKTNAPVSIARTGIYESLVKPCMDKVISFMSLVLFSPVFLLICLAVYLDDPGPIFFSQKRVGKDKRLFCLHKFRTMKMETPHDIPTHQLKNPEQYITRVGKLLRRTSLDELPQLWDIFRGEMSVVGPRPALWNQDDLIAERDKYGANGIRPGLTGWAQINGRDELEIPNKAQLDGEYVRRLRQGGLRALFFDVKCIAGTAINVLVGDGVVEGGTGSMGRGEFGSGDEEDAGFEDYAYKKKFIIDTSAANHKRVLITGTGSYIGDSFAAYAEEHYGENFTVDAVDMLDESWKEKDFSSYDTVFHVAGIAHADVGNVDEETKRKYYAVNTELAIETAKKAREEGVRQFILMSSMIIYGDSAPCGKQKVIDEYTVPAPSGFYGDSKWQADKGVRSLATEDFHVAVLRPPMIYGRGSRGNYPILAKLAKRLPAFPNINNCRSMLYIDNLCRFLCLLMLAGEGGIFFPQNASYVKTADMVKEVCRANGGNIYILRILNPAVALGSRMPGKIGGLVNKAFGNAVYSKKLSVYDGLKYQETDLKESIMQTEAEGKNKKPSVLFLVNHDVVIYNFRLELVERLLKEGYDVHISSPYGERIDDLVAIGAKYHEITIDRHGTNPVTEFSVLKEYKRLIKKVVPVIVFGYTIKPNIYGAIAARQAHVPFVANITGLGTAVENGGWQQKVTVALYKFAFANVQRVFFQNEENKEFFKRAGIAVDKHALLPGSGVNLTRFPVQPYPSGGDGTEGEPIRFAFISRIMKEKGIEQFLNAAEEVKRLFPSTEFHICGFCEAEYEGRLEELETAGTVIYHGMIRDVASFLKDIHCVVHPTYYPEGISNVLLEACSSGRPIITTDRSGCREVVEDGVNGYMVHEKDEEALIDAIEKFIALENNTKQQMGLNGRKKVEAEFSREIVVSAYMEELKD